MMPDGVLRLVTGFALVVFLMTGSLGVYGFLALQPGVHWRGKAVWYLGAAIVGLSVLTVVGTLVSYFVRAVGL